jgi:hypothetical protein
MRRLLVLFVVVLGARPPLQCTADGVPNEDSAEAEEAPMEEEKWGMYASIERFIG